MRSTTCTVIDEPKFVFHLQHRGERDDLVVVLAVVGLALAIADVDDDVVMLSRLVQYECVPV